METLNLPVFEDEEINRAFVELSRVVNKLDPYGILSGVLVSNQVIRTTGTQVRHKLGRVPQGFFVVKSSGAGQVYGSLFNKNYLNLTATTEVTVSLWVF